MKLSLKRIYDALPALELLNNEEFSGAVSYSIDRNIRKLKSKDIVEYEKQIRELVFVKYDCVVGQKNRLMTKDPQKQEQFDAEAKALGGIEIEVEILLIPVEAIKSVKKITPAEIALLRWMLDESAEETATKTSAKVPRKRKGK